jgi:Rieske Fe-S protein
MPPRKRKTPVKNAAAPKRAKTTKPLTSFAEVANGRTSLIITKDASRIVLNTLKLTTKPDQQKFAQICKHLGDVLERLDELSQQVKSRQHSAKYAIFPKPQPAEVAPPTDDEGEDF